MNNENDRAQTARMFWILVKDARVAVQNGECLSVALADIDDELDVLDLYTEWPLMKQRLAAARCEFAAVPRVAEAG